jgi:hypothetical protein
MNMAQMIRKQIYIAERQQALLSRLARFRGVSEAEVIRQAIEHEATRVHVQPVTPNTTALDEIIQAALARRELGEVGEPLQWRRDDAYAERLEQMAVQSAASQK